MWISTVTSDTGTELTTGVGAVAVSYFCRTRDISTSGEVVVLSLCGDRADKETIEEVSHTFVVGEVGWISCTDLETVGFGVCGIGDDVATSTTE